MHISKTNKKNLCKTEQWKVVLDFAIMPQKFLNICTQYLLCAYNYLVFYGITSRKSPKITRSWWTWIVCIILVLCTLTSREIHIFLIVLKNSKMSPWWLPNQGERLDWTGSVWDINTRYNKPYVTLIEVFVNQLVW